MIENLKDINDKQIKLGHFTEDDLDQLYLRVFGSEDGEMVLADLANRCYIFETSEESPLNEGMRAVYLSIQSRLLGAVAIKPKKEE